MNTTDKFKEVIECKLQEMAANNELFAINFQRENKNIDDCLKFILNTVKKSGVCGFTDDEVFGMAAHYYDENDVVVGGDLKCQVIVNQHVQLTEEEKREAKQTAIDKEVDAQRSKLKAKKAKKAEKKEIATDQTLFPC